MKKQQKEQEELFEHIIKRTSDECKEENDTFFYREVLMELAPYLFPNEKDAPTARSRMLHALNKARTREGATTTYTNRKPIVSKCQNAKKPSKIKGLKGVKNVSKIRVFQKSPDFDTENDTRRKEGKG